MPFVPMNIFLEQALTKSGFISMPYPEGKNEGHFFGGNNHTLSVDGAFFRSPRDFTVITHPDHITFTWHNDRGLPARALLNMQLESPGGDFYFDPKIGVTVLNMVVSPLFMVNLASPAPADPDYWVARCEMPSGGVFTLAKAQTPAPRNVVIHADGDVSQCVFTIEGVDLYKHPMVETITGSGEGNKAFTRILRISVAGKGSGDVSIGTGNKLGLPVFLPSPGYLIREIVNGQAVIGGIIASGEVGAPTATTGDRRGTYTPPQTIPLDGKHSIHLLVSTPAPGNIGIPDFAG